jgi:hypothetical protein
VLEFPDGSRANAFSRLFDIGSRRCIYTFTLTEEQSLILREELAALSRILGSQE